MNTFNLMRKAGFCLALALLAGCKEKVEPKPQTYTQLLTGTTSKSWTVANLQLLERNLQPVTFGLPSCLRDDLYVFYADSEKRFQVTEGRSKCEASDPDVIAENNWTMVNASATLTMVIPFLSDEPLPFIVKQLTSSTMILEIYLPDPANTSYRITFNSTGG